jgi:oxygen-dependent protoporphyrinogen oxidase
MRTETAKRVTVIGAGFSGLASAYYLAKAGYQVDVLESADREGGLISTLKTDDGIVETAANGILSSNTVEELFADLGLEFSPTLRTARRRYIFRDRRLRQWPLSISSTLRLLKFIFFFFAFRSHIEPRSTESVHVWAARTMGWEAGLFLIEPALQGIYAGPASQLSASLIFSRFFGDRSLRPITRGRIRGTIAPIGGMGELVKSMKKKLLEMGVVFERRFVGELADQPRHPWIIATPAFAAAGIVRRLFPQVADLLNQVTYLPLISTTVFFHKTHEKSRGFGILFPRCEKRPFLGVLKNNFIFPGRSARAFSETWMMGDMKVSDMSDEKILELIVEERKSCFGLNEKPASFAVNRWEKALPFYSVDLERMMGQISESRKNILLMGNYLGQIGLRQILEVASQLPGRIANEGQWE